MTIPANPNSAYASPAAWKHNRLAQPIVPAVPQPTPHFQANEDPKSKAKPSGQPNHGHAAANQADASIWRDSALRYGGYADEVGEFLTPFLGSVGTFLGYGISTAYVAADMLTTLPKQYHNASPEFGRAKKTAQTAKEAVDLGLFHAIATLLIPPMLIGGVVKTAGGLLEKPATEAAKHVGKEASKGFSLMKGIENGRELLEKGMESSVSFAAPTTRRWADNLVTKFDPWITRKIQPTADEWLKNNHKGMANFVGGLAKFAEAASKKSGIKHFITPDLAKELRHNYKAISTKTSFDPKELTRKLVLKPIPVAIGIAMVPLIAHPFDELMLKIQDWTIRPLLGKNKIVTNTQGKRQSIKNPTFWGHEQQGATQAAKPPANGTITFPPPHPRHHLLKAQARFGYYHPLTGFGPNPLYPKPMMPPSPFMSMAAPWPPMPAAWPITSAPFNAPGMPSFNPYTRLPG